MNKTILNQLQPRGTVARRVIDTRKLFVLAKTRGVVFTADFDSMLAQHKSATFKVITLAMANTLGSQETAMLIDKCLKKQFADNVLWRVLKAKFNIDIQLPLLTGYYTKHAVVRPNLVVTTGHARYAGQIGGTTTTPMTALAIGTSSTAPAAADTTLGAEITTNGGSRGAATVSNTTTTTTGDTEQWQKTWTITGALAIQEEGIFDNNTSGGTLLAHNTFTTVNVVNGDTFQVTHKIQS